MHEEDDDKPTVVIDFNSLKQELDQEEVLTDDDSLIFNEQLEVLEDPTEVGLNLEDQIEETRKNIYFFDYQSDYFAQNFSGTNEVESSFILTDLESLNQALTDDPKSIIVFYYNGNPKVTNQLSKQIREKFLATKCLIIAKNLSPKKAQEHHQSKYGADAYLRDPFEILQFYQTINKLELD